MTEAPVKINRAQQRVAAVLLTLAGHEEFGLAQTQVAKAVGVADHCMHRDLRNLLHAGLVERMDDKRWRLGPKLVQIALAHAQALGAMKARIGELEQRYSRLPK